MRPESETSENMPPQTHKAPTGSGPLLPDLSPSQFHRPMTLTRIIESIIAIIVLALTLPVLFVLAVVVRLDSPGPPLFFQTRVGLGGWPFKLVKFRTMYSDARERFPDMYAYSYSEAELDNFKIKDVNDPRTTRLGRWLRTSTLDEIPNFWNVLTGDMALVGPRPEIPELIKYYVGEEREKFLVRPGITGLAQVSGRGRLRFKESTALDVQYVRERNWLLDIKIVLRTIRIVILRDGAF